MRKKRITTNGSLYITVIILVYSLICWSVFVNNIGEYIVQKIRTESIAEESNLNDKKTKKDERSVDEVPISEKTTPPKKNIVDRGINRAEIIFNDSICYRNELSKIDSLVTYLSSREVVSEQIVMGKDGWMFYSGQADGGDPVADYEGTNLLSQGEIEITAHNEMIIQNALTARGIKFVVLIAPNKESVYYNYYSDKYLHASKSKADILIDYMLKRGINVIWPKETMISCDFKNLYYKYDSHWNLLGAYIGVREILDFWNIDIPELNEMSIGQSNHNPPKDLANISGLTSVLDDDVEYNIDNIDWEGDILEQIEEEQLTTYSHIRNESAKVDAKLILVGDSFRINMIPILSSYFTDVYVVDRENYNVSLLDVIKPDYFISEHVERQLYKLLEDRVLIE